MYTYMYMYMHMHMHMHMYMHMQTHTRNRQVMAPYERHNVAHRAAAAQQAPTPTDK